MTCIVGIEKHGTVWLGGDSAGTDSSLGQRIIEDPKVFIVGNELAFGICGSPKVMDAIRFNIEFPKNKRNKNDREFFSKEIVPTLKEGLKKHGCVIQHPKHGELFEGALLVGYQGKLYNIEANFQVITTAYRFNAVGSGQDIAIGSLHATENVDSPHKRILMALEASAINNAGVRPPFNIVSVKRKN
jgi:ATP-dependent protease HslVU (ClpYQ) peptidase subunit